jgi:hypothetical protein
MEEAALGIRLVLSDRQWERIAPYIIGDERTRGSSGRDNRLFVEAVLWLVRTGVRRPSGLNRWRPDGQPRSS